MILRPLEFLFETLSYELNVGETVLDQEMF